MHHFSNYCLPCHPRSATGVHAGYMENGESSAAGAARETWEEAGARVEIEAPFVHFDIPGISQVCGGGRR